MKNLVNCTPSEFLKQTNRIRKSVEKWLKVTDIMAIRKRMPEGMPEVKSDMSKDEARAVLEKRKSMLAEQSQRNLKAMLDAMLDEHPDETLEILALCSFIEPEDIDNYTITTLVHTFNEILQDKDVMDFFTLLTSLVK